MKNKTYKREVAVIMIAFLADLFYRAVSSGDPIALEAAKFLTTPIFTFAGLAFGFDAYSKQVKP